MTVQPLIEFERFQDLLAGDGLDEWQLAVASGAIRAYCGWHVAPVQRETLVLDGDGGTILDLPTLRMTGLDEVRVRGVVVEGVEWSSDGTLRGRWPDVWRGIEIDLTHGFDEAPADLLGVLVDAAARAVNSTLGGAGAEVIGPFSFSATEGSTALFGHELAVLDRYALPRLA